MDYPYAWPSGDTYYRSIILRGYLPYGYFICKSWPFYHKHPCIYFNKPYYFQGFQDLFGYYTALLLYWCCKNIFFAVYCCIPAPSACTPASQPPCIPAPLHPPGSTPPPAPPHISPPSWLNTQSPAPPCTSPPAWLFTHPPPPHPSLKQEVVLINMLPSINITFSHQLLWSLAFITCGYHY